jgi:hypothetical protein
VHAIEFDAARVRAVIAEDADHGREVPGRMLMSSRPACVRVVID